MDSMSIIPLLSDGKYCVEEQVLQSIVSKARENECTETAVISIHGHNQNENIFLLKSLVSYLSANDRFNWPKSCRLAQITGDDTEDQKPIVRMYSKPFVLKCSEPEQKIAVFLMDATNVFHGNDVDIVQQITHLFLKISSTVLFLSSREIKVIFN